MSSKVSAKKILEEVGAEAGDVIKIVKPNITYKGILLDRPETFDKNYITLKLDNGYNIGIDISDAKIELIEKSTKSEIKFEGLDIKEDPNLPFISIISTGGTISSIIDYRTGAVHPRFTANDLLNAYPELLDEANIKCKEILNILSENMDPKYWEKIARAIYKEIKNGVDGIVVTHGTDTMHYTAAALAFMIRTPIPIILTGAQRSSDRPSTDARLNLISSVVAAKSDIAEVAVCMHATPHDRECYLHRGVKVRKMHTSRRDAFLSINDLPLAKIKDNKVEIINNNYIKRDTMEPKLNNKLEPKVALIKTYPGMNAEIIDFYVENNYQGIVIEGTGLGHCAESLIPSIKRAKDAGIPVVMTSQCINGRINMNVYSTGRKLLKAGVIPAQDMLPEVALVKLMWVLGQTKDFEEVSKMMTKNLVGEINNKSSLIYFPGGYHGLEKDRS